MKFHLMMRKHEIYRDSDNVVEPLLHELATAPIIGAGKLDI